VTGISVVDKPSPQLRTFNMPKHSPLKFLVPLLALLLAGCVPFGQEGTSRPPRAPSGGVGKWQTVWIDPQIVESGANFTLMRSDRVDSVAVEGNVDYTPGNSPSLTFHIGTRNCDSRIELLDAKDRVVKQLMNRRLEAGHYKLSLDEQGMAPGVYSLRAYYCGRTAKKTFAVGR
jgi:hypothetical protein